MYSKHFNFKEKPFNLTPDPRFLYLSPGHQEALASMIYGIKEKRGFISIIGEIGIGKTTLLHTLFKELGDEIKTVFIFNTKITFTELLQNILIELNLTPAGDNKTALISQLNDYLIGRLAANETVAVIIDEAQNLSPEVLEELRMLSNLETPKEKLLQIVLVGQPELDSILRSQNLRQLKQRIAINCYLTALNREDQMKYIAHRLTIAGHKGNQVFTPGALELICKHSRGIPRLINIFCDNALLTAYGKELSRVDAEVMEEIINDYEHSKMQPAVDKAAPVAVPAGKKRSRAQVLLIAFLIFLNLLVAFLLALNLMQTPGLFSRLVTAAANKLPVMSRVKGQPPVKETPAPAPAPPQALEAPVPAQVEPVRFTDTESQESSPDAIGATPEERAEEEPAPAAAAAPEPEPVAPALENQQRALMAKSGDIVSALATREYGTLTNTVCDIIKRANPGIKDLDRIYVGDKILIPPLDIESLIVAEDNGTFSIHLATFSANSDAQQLKKILSDRNYAPSVYPVKLIGSQPWYRVTLGNYPDRSAAIAFARNIDLDSALLPFPVNDIMQSLKGMKTPD